MERISLINIEFTEEDGFRFELLGVETIDDCRALLGVQAGKNFLYFSILWFNFEVINEE